MRWLATLCLLGLLSFGITSGVVYGQATDGGAVAAASLPHLDSAAPDDQAIAAAVTFAAGASDVSPGAAAIAGLFGAVVLVRKYGSKIWPVLGSGTGAAGVTIALGFLGSLANDLGEGRPWGASSTAAWGVIGGAAALWSLSRPLMVPALDWLELRVPAVRPLVGLLRWVLEKPPAPPSRRGRPISGRTLADSNLREVSGRGVGTSPSDPEAAPGRV